MLRLLLLKMGLQGDKATHQGPRGGGSLLLSLSTDVRSLLVTLYRILKVTTLNLESTTKLGTLHSRLACLATSLGCTRRSSFRTIPSLCRSRRTATPTWASLSDNSVTTLPFYRESARGHWCVAPPPPPLQTGGGATHQRPLDTVACSSRVLLTCALLMTSPHSKATTARWPAGNAEALAGSQRVMRHGFGGLGTTRTRVVAARVRGLGEGTIGRHSIGDGCV